MTNRIPTVRLALAAALTLAIGVHAYHGDATADSATPQAGLVTGPPVKLSGGAPSIEVLLDEFLAALERKDTEALERLRLTKAEYTEIIMPGQAKKGQPPLQTFQVANDTAWGLLNSRSRYSLEAIVRDFGGRHYVKHSLEFTESPPREYAWFTAYGGVQLTLWDEQDEAHELRTGWIADVGGTHKFIGFNRGD